MASSGTYTETIRTGYQIKLVWTVDGQNIANNASTVTAKVQLVSTGSGYTINASAAKSGTLTINGTAYSFTFDASLAGSQTKTIFTKTVVVPHNSDGSKTCTFRADAEIAVTLSGTYYGTVTVSGTGTFNDIPRASSLSISPTTVIMGNSITIAISAASGTFTHTLTYVFGSLSGTIATGVGASYTWTVPVSLANAVTKAVSGKGTITCKTYSASTLVGTKSVNFTASVPNSVVPTISAVSITENVAGIASKFAGFLQNRSKLNVSISAAGAYASTITKYTTTIQGVSYAGNAFVSGTLTESGTIAVVTTVTDSRGRTAQATNNIAVLTYEPPKITAFSAYRCDASGALDYNGEYLKIEYNYSISAVNNLNDKEYKILYRLKDTETWSNIASGNVYAQNTSIVTDALFDADNEYELSFDVTDFFGTVTAYLDIPTSFSLIDIRSTGKGIEFGGVSAEDCFGVSMDAKFRKNVNVTGTFSASNIKIGSDSITPSAANTATSKTITFDSPLSSVPKVFITAKTTYPGTVVKGISVNNVTVNGFVVWIIRTDTTATNFDWLAIC